MWLVGIVICGGWIFSLCLHEFSHALVAYWGGDISVKRKGYLTFNPLKYTDPGYSIALPLLFLLMGGIGLPGGAVFINQQLLRNRWWQSAVSVAGPTANILIALLLAFSFQLVRGDSVLINQINEDSFLSSGIAFLIYLQVFATIFNLLPLPGLDGYGAIEPWLPDGVRAKFDRFSKYSTLLIIILFWFVPGFSNFTFTIVGFISEKFLKIPNVFIAMGGYFFRQPINQLTTLVTLLIFGWSLNYQNKHPLKKRKNLATNKPLLPHQVRPETCNRANILAGQDLKRIQRLLNGARLKNPDRSEQWYWEKIIYDMERDRR